jgi:hypothetical protein
MKKGKKREDEVFYWKIKRYSGPKTPFKVVVSIILFVCFMFGFMMLTTKPIPTGYVVSGVNKKNWLGFVLLFIPLIFVLWWLRRLKSIRMRF